MLLNLINNFFVAFYSESSQHGDLYRSLVTMSTGPILFCGSAEEMNTRIHTNTHFGVHLRCVNHTDHAFDYNTKKKTTKKRRCPSENINALQNQTKKQSLCLCLYPTPNELENKNNSPNKSNSNSKHSSRPSHTNFG